MSLAYLSVNLIPLHLKKTSHSLDLCTIPPAVLSDRPLFLLHDSLYLDGDLPPIWVNSIDLTWGGLGTGLMDVDLRGRASGKILAFVTNTCHVLSPSKPTHQRELQRSLFMHPNVQREILNHTPFYKEWTLIPKSKYPCVKEKTVSLMSP